MPQIYYISALAAFVMGVALILRTFAIYRESREKYLLHFVVFLILSNIYLMFPLIPYLVWLDLSQLLWGKFWSALAIVPIISSIFLLISLHEFTDRKILVKSKLLLFLFIFLIIVALYILRFFLANDSFDVQTYGFYINIFFTFMVCLAFFMSSSLKISNSKQQKILLQWMTIVSVVCFLIPLAVRALQTGYAISYEFFLIALFSSKLALHTLYFIYIRRFVTIFSGENCNDTNPVDPKLALLDKFGISKRENEVISLICRGKTNYEIGEELFISLQTVKDHTSRIYKKAGVKNRVQLTNLFRDPKI